MRTTWTSKEILDFREWHEKRLKELNYPALIEKKLRETRENWMPKEKK